MWPEWGLVDSVCQGRATRAGVKVAHPGGPPRLGGGAQMAGGVQSPYLSGHRWFLSLSFCLVHPVNTEIIQDSVRTVSFHPSRKKCVSKEQTKPKDCFCLLVTLRCS